MKATTCCVLLLAAIAVGTSVGLQNGLCTAEFCACQITFPTSASASDAEPPDCAGWMATRWDGGLYDKIASSHCKPQGNGAGVLTCIGYVDSFFANFPNESTATAAVSDATNTTTTCSVTSWVVQDGLDVIVNYTTLDPPPECPEDAPATLGPSMAPGPEGGTMSPTPSGTGASGGGTLSLDTPALLSIASVILRLVF